MGTSAGIIKKESDGTYRGIRVNYDGYPSHMLKRLTENYTNESKIDELLDLGEISSLGIRVHPIGKHSFADAEFETTVAYHRDRGEDKWEAVTDATIDGIKSKLGNESYNYVFDKSWKCC